MHLGHIFWLGLAKTVFLYCPPPLQKPREPPHTSNGLSVAAFSFKSENIWDKTCTTPVVPFSVGDYTFWRKKNRRCASLVRSPLIVILNGCFLIPLLSKAEHLTTVFLSVKHHYRIITQSQNNHNGRRRCNYTNFSRTVHKRFDTVISPVGR